MVFKGCPRCGGDLLVDEDIVSHVEELVCLQCGHRQEATPDTEEHANATRWLMSQRPLRIAA